MKNLTNWFQRLSTEKKLSVAVLITVGICVIFLTAFSFAQKRQLALHGIYYVAQIDKIATGKTGRQFHIKYQYRNTQYSGNFKPGLDFKPNRKGAFIFIKFLPDNPKVYRYIDQGEVTDSLLNTLPENGWARLPEVPKQYLLNGKYIQID